MAKPNKPVLVYAIKFSNVGGAPFHVLQLMTYFRQWFDIHLLVGSWSEMADEAQQRGIVVHQLPNMGKDARVTQFIRLIGDLRQIYRELRPALVHAHAPLVGVACRWAGLLEKIPVLTTVHSWNFAPGMPWTRRISAWILEYTVGKLRQPIITVSQYDYQLGLQYHVARRSQMTKIHNGIADRRSISCSRPAESRPVRLVMVARQDVRKCHDQLLHALSSIRDKFELYLIGDGPHASCNKALAATLGLSQQVQFLGQRSDVAELLEDMDIAVLVSQAEGLPLSILEAMRAGLPVVSSDVGGCREAVLDGETGYLVPMNDVATLTRRLDTLIGDEKLRATFGQAGRKWFETEFHEHKMLETTHALYLSLTRDDVVARP